MRLEVTGDPVGFRDLMLPFLSADPVRHSVIAGQLETRASGLVVDPVPGLFAAVRNDDDLLAGVAARFGDRGMFLGDLDDDFVPAVAELVAARAPELPAIEARPSGAAVFAACWKARRGAGSRQGVLKRLYRLGRLVPPYAPGSPRAAAPGDAELIERWVLAFDTEVGEPPRETRRTADEGIAEGRFWFWEDEGRVVSLAGHGVSAAGGSRIGPVYTPPEERGHGYASALTAFVAQRLLDRGDEVCLYADLANPTSTKIYLAIGFEPVTDLVRLYLG